MHDNLRILQSEVIVSACLNVRNIFCEIADEQSESRAALKDQIEIILESKARDYYGKNFDLRVVMGKDFRVRLYQIMSVAEQVDNEYRQLSLHNARKLLKASEIGDTLVKQIPLVHPADLKTVEAFHLHNLKILPSV